MGRDVETLVKDQDLIVRRHETISDAALKLFARKGYHETTVREIAEASGLGIGTLYSYIKTKEDILYLIYQRIFSHFQERMRAAVEGIDDPALQLRVALETTLRIYDEFQDTVLLLYQESHVLSRRTLQSLFEVDRLYVFFFEEILRRGNQRGIFRVKEPNLMAISLLFLCAVWALKRWNLKQYSLRDVVDTLLDLVFKGIMSQPELDRLQAGRKVPSSNKEAHNE